MDLTRLSMGDLREVQGALCALVSAGEVLERAGFVPAFDLTDRETVVRCGAILDERSSVDVEPVVLDDAPVPDEPATAAPRRLAETHTAEPAAETAASCLPPVRPREIGADGLVRGTWLPEEDDRLRDMAASGAGWTEIALALNRPATAVTFRARKVMGLAARRRGAGEPEAGDGGRDPSPATEPDAGPRAAPALPVPEGVAPAGLAGEARDLWHMLGGIEADAAFDHEADFDLVDGLAHGRTLASVAEDLGVAASRAGARFRLLTEPVRDARGRIRIDGQQALLRALRARMLAARGQAA